MTEIEHFRNMAYAEAKELVIRPYEEEPITAPIVRSLIDEDGIEFEFWDFSPFKQYVELCDSKK